MKPVPTLTPAPRRRFTRAAGRRQHLDSISEAAAGAGLAQDPQPARDRFPWDRLSFGYHLGGENNKTCHLNSGTVYVHGFPAEGGTVAAGTKTLTGATCWVCVTYTLGAGAAFSVSGTTNAPLSSAAAVVWPLYKFILRGTRYTLAPEGIKWLGDIHILTPLIHP